MPILSIPGEQPLVIAPPPGSIDVASMPQPQRIGIQYVDPDGNTWDFMDLDMTDGFICTGIRGIGGAPVQLSTIPLVRGGAIAQLMTYQPRQLGMGIFALGQAEAQNDYLDLLDRLAIAFTNIRDDAPAPGTLIFSRPDGSQRQISVYCTSGQDQPDDDNTLSGLLYTTYALTMEAPDPFFYDALPTSLAFGSPVSSSALAYYDFETDVQGFTGSSAAGTGTTAVSLSTTFFSTGAQSLRLDPDGTSVTPEARGPVIPVTPGQVITITGDFWCNVALTGTGQIGFRAFSDAAGTAFVSSSYITGFNMTANTKTTKTFSYTVPTDGSIQSVKFTFRINGTTPPTTTHMYGDNITLTNKVGILPLLPIALNGASSFGDIIVTNDGQADAYPVWTLTGPGTPTIQNVTTGRSWSWDIDLTAGQVVVVNTMPGQQSAIDQGTGLSVWSHLVTNSPRDLWPLVKGDNDINISVTNATAQTAVAMSYLRRWLRS